VFPGDVEQDLQELANPAKAKLLSRFFKTGKGEYGEGDVFLGITVPQQRGVATKHSDLPKERIRKLLDSRIHEHRLTALLILVKQFSRAGGSERKGIVDLYMRNTRNINNWDLVDLSAPRILGDYLKDRNRKILYRLAKSENVWERRISVLATFAFIRDDDFNDSLKIAEMLLEDSHDLIHKAVGWMLREIGKRDQRAEENFLEKHNKRMPRTMLRYAIERFPEKKRKSYMKR
jgi:3-methyladenine DNA glycosylase AlkD